MLSMKLLELMSDLADLQVEAADDATDPPPLWLRDLEPLTTSESPAHSGQKSINIFNPPFLLIFANCTCG